MGIELIVVLAGSVAVASFARWRGWPAPLVVTAVALAVSMLPFMPALEIDGELLLTATLPPLLYSAANGASFTSFKRAMPHVRRLGVGLVVTTAAVVGVVAWLLMPELGLAGALLLGAIVGPPDAVSAAAIGRKLGLPRRVMTVLSGESLINDATSLTLVRVFAAVVAGATVTVWDGLREFGLAVILGVGVGLLFGVVLHQLRMRMDDATVTSTFGLLMPFGAYVLAEQIHGSGVLAVVAMGFYVGYHAPRTSYAHRQHDKPIWSAADFVLESFVFAYVGLQFPDVLRTVTEHDGGSTLGLAGVVLLIVLLLRPIFVFASYGWGRVLERLRLRRWEQLLPRRRERQRAQRERAMARLEGDENKERRLAKMRRRQRQEPTTQQMMLRLTEPQMTWQERVVISWSGMRGVVTLALAVALPEITGHAMADGQVEAIIAVAYIVTVGTLLLQGLTLPALIAGLKVTATDESADDSREIVRMRQLSKKAGIAFLEEEQERWTAVYGPTCVTSFNQFSRGLLKIEQGAERGEREIDDATEKGIAAPANIGHEQFMALSKGWLAIRREVALEQSRAGNLSEEVMREVFDAIDAEELALDTKGALRRE